jgi:hypothetical protein
VHETVNDSIISRGGSLAASDITIEHHNFSHRRHEKNEWYLSLLNEELALHPESPRLLGFLAATYHQMGMLDRAGEVADKIAKLRPWDSLAQSKAEYYHRGARA